MRTADRRLRSAAMTAGHQAASVLHSPHGATTPLASALSASGAATMLHSRRVASSTSTPQGLHLV